MITPLAQAADDALIDDALTGGDWLRAAAILLGALILAVVTSQVLRRVIAHGLGHGFAAIMTARLLGYAIFLVGLFYALTTLGVRVGPLLGALGLGGLVLALALQSPVENFVASVILQSRRPFTIDDTIEIDGVRGIVTDIDSRTTRLRGLDGTQIRLPNTKVLAGLIVNLTREPVRRSALTVGVAYDTDLARASEVLYEAVDRVERVRSTRPPTVNLDGFGESSVDFTIFFWHDSDVPSELATRTDLTIAVHQALSSAGITIAFPQVVVWGGESETEPYAERPDVVRLPYPGLDATRTVQKRRPAPWRRASRRPDDA